MAKLSQENVQRLRQIVKDGVQVLQECEDLKQGLTETVKSVADELEVKPALITKLIKIRQKGKMNELRDDNEILEELYKAAGFE